MTKIAILGAGAMGGVYGAKLFAAGLDVTLIDIWKDHVETIATRGLKIEGLEEGQLFKTKITSDLSEVSIVDLLIIQVKAYDTKTAITSARHLIGPETIVLSLQNGLGNLEIIQEIVGSDHVIGGVTSHGAYVIGPGHISHTAHSYTAIGELNGQITPRLENLGQILEKASLAPIIISNDVNNLIWKKLMGNIAVNAITAICGICNGEILENEQTKEISRLAILEAEAVARAKGINIDYDPVAVGWKVITDTAPNRSSMLQDISAKRQTEVEYINGAIVKLGREFNIPTPVNQTLTSIVSAIQNKFF